MNNFNTIMFSFYDGSSWSTAAPVLNNGDTFSLFARDGNLNTNESFLVYTDNITGTMDVLGVSSNGTAGAPVSLGTFTFGGNRGGPEHRHYLRGRAWPMALTFYPSLITTVPAKTQGRFSLHESFGVAGALDGIDTPANSWVLICIGIVWGKERATEADATVATPAATSINAADPMLQGAKLLATGIGQLSDSDPAARTRAVHPFSLPAVFARIVTPAITAPSIPSHGWRPAPSRREKKRYAAPSLFCSSQAGIA